MTFPVIAISLMQLMQFSVTALHYTNTLIMSVFITDVAIYMMNINNHVKLQRDETAVVKFVMDRWRSEVGNQSVWIIEFICQLNKDGWLPLCDVAADFLGVRYSVSEAKGGSVAEFSVLRIGHEPQTMKRFRQCGVTQLHFLLCMSGEYCVGHEHGLHLMAVTPDLFRMWPIAMGMIDVT